MVQGDQDTFLQDNTGILEKFVEQSVIGDSCCSELSDKRSHWRMLSSENIGTDAGVISETSRDKRQNGHQV
jgi:hypothetical protein